MSHICEYVDFLLKEKVLGDDINPSWKPIAMLSYWERTQGTLRPVAGAGGLAAPEVPVVQVGQTFWLPSHPSAWSGLSGPG